jgi:type IV pilus assembly protein PilE
MQNSVTPSTMIASRIVARTRGFTLIELMIAVVIVAILGAIALPSFLDSVRKGRRSDAVTAIAQAQQAEERFRANNALYSDDFATSGLNMVTSASAVTSFTTTAGYYALTLPTTATSSAYSVLATAQGSQANDTTCKYMKFTASAGTITYASGSTSSVSNGTSANKACWKQ